MTVHTQYVVKFGNIFNWHDKNSCCNAMGAELLSHYIFTNCHSHSFKTDDVCTILPYLTFGSKFCQYFLKSHLLSSHLISYSKFETLYQESTIIWGQCQPAECSRALHWVGDQWQWEARVSVIYGPTLKNGLHLIIWAVTNTEDVH